MPTILLVEDDEGFRQLTRIWFTSHGYRVVEARNGAEGWELLRREPPDAVITDIEMPEMDGVELCRRIKVGQKTSGIPVLMFTSHGEMPTQLAGTSAGADAYLTKQTDYRILGARIDSLLRERARQDDATRREVETVRRQTVSQAVATLAHHLKNSLLAIRATADVIDPANAEQAARLRAVCLAEVPKMNAVLTALSAMAEQDTLRTTEYLGNELMFDLERELARLAAPPAPSGGPPGSPARS